MNINDIKPAITGDNLLQCIKTSKDQRRPIADGLLYENTIVMMAAAPGVGKSTISTQVAVELAAGIPIFGVFEVHRPVKVLYAQTERPIIELLERLEIISKVYPLAKNNLVVTEEYKMFNLLKEEHVKLMIQAIKRDCPGVEVIFIDPIYPMVSGGLSKDEPASAFTKAMSMIQKETGACLYYNHHTSRTQYTGDGDAIEKDDPFYGSQWLKAHCTGSYYIKPTEIGVTLFKKKDNYKCLESPIILEYNPETELSIVPSNALSVVEKVKTYLKARESDGKQFTFNDMHKALGCATRSLRKAVVHSSIRDRLIVVSSLKNRHLYRVESTCTEL